MPRFKRTKTRTQACSDHFIRRAMERGVPSKLWQPQTLWDYIQKQGLQGKGGVKLSKSRTAYLLRYDEQEWVIIYSNSMSRLITIMPRKFFHDPMKGIGAIDLTEAIF